MSLFEATAGHDTLGGQAEVAFLEPWHAEVFSLAVVLNRKGVFTWTEWVAVFSATSREIPPHESESLETTYYRRWLAALERLVAQRGFASREEMATRKEEWRRAFLRTPHGQPIALDGLEVTGTHNHGGLPQGHRHPPRRHATAPRPVAVSAARV
jgi:nitrile hydratase accessory protein